MFTPSRPEGRSAVRRFRIDAPHIRAPQAHAERWTDPATPRDPWHGDDLGDSPPPDDDGSSIFE